MVPTYQYTAAATFKQTFSEMLHPSNWQSHMRHQPNEGNIGYKNILALQD